MANVLTDITPVLNRAFPGGKPEMAAGDFDRALRFCQGRRTGAVPKPQKGTMDYIFWAHAMVVEQRLLADEWAKSPATQFTGTAPKFLICPECEVMLLMDMQQGDVLVCPGGCHRAITVATFVQLFKPAPRPVPVPRNLTSNLSQHWGAYPGSSGPRAGSNVGLNTRVPRGASPADYGITEGVQKSKKALVGWRMWDITPEEPDYLKSLHMKGIERGWPHMTPIRGMCQGKTLDEIKDHVCPAWTHTCGVYAVKEPKQTPKWGNLNVGPNSRYVRVLGEIEMWGRVLEYEEGYRAEWAYPKKLYLPSTLPDIFTETPEALAETLWQGYLTEVVIDDHWYHILA